MKLINIINIKIKDNWTWTYRKRKRKRKKKKLIWEDFKSHGVKNRLRNEVKKTKEENGK